MLEMSSHAEKMSEIVYPIIMTLVNLCNAYDKKEIDPEMLELAKFAKHHVPEEHEFDDPDFVANRVEVNFLKLNNLIFHCLICNNLTLSAIRCWLKLE